MRVVVCETCSELNMTRNNFKGSGFNCNRCFYYTKSSYTKKVLPKQGGFGGCKSDSEITYLNGTPSIRRKPVYGQSKMAEVCLLKITYTHPMAQCIRNQIPPETEEVCTNLKSPQTKAFECRLKALQELDGASANAQFHP